MILHILFSLVLQSPAKTDIVKVYQPKVNETSIQAIHRLCLASEKKVVDEKKKRRQSLTGTEKEICSCLVRNLPLRVPEQELFIVAKGESGFDVEKDIEAIEGAQTLFDFYEDVKNLCRKNTGYELPAEDFGDPDPVTSGQQLKADLQRRPNSQILKKQTPKAK